MKNNLIKIYASLFFFCASFAAFAEPGDDNAEGTLESVDAPAPIDDYVLVFGLVALVLVFFKLRSRSQVTLKN